MKKFTMGVLAGVAVNLLVRRAIWAWRQTKKIDEMVGALIQGDIARADQIQSALAEQGIDVTWQGVDLGYDEDEM